MKSNARTTALIAMAIIAALSIWHIAVRTTGRVADDFKADGGEGAVRERDATGSDDVGGGEEPASPPPVATDDPLKALPVWEQEGIYWQRDWMASITNGVIRFPESGRDADSAEYAEYVHLALEAIRSQGMWKHIEAEGYRPTVNVYEENVIVAFHPPPPPAGATRGRGRVHRVIIDIKTKTAIKYWM